MSIISFSISNSPPSRLDKALSRDAPAQAGLSRTRLTRLITDGYVAVDGDIVKNPTANVSEGQSVKVLMPELEPVETLPQKINLDIIYEDKDLLVVNKVAGMVVHPAPGSPKDTLVNALLHHCQNSLSGIGGEKRPGIVHRIDKDTSGLLVVAKNDFERLQISSSPEEFLDKLLNDIGNLIVKIKNLSESANFDNELREVLSDSTNIQSGLSRYKAEFKNISDAEKGVLNEKREKYLK